MHIHAQRVKKEKQQAANITENDRSHFLKSSYMSNIRSISSRGIVTNNDGNELDSLFEGSLAGEKSLYDGDVLLGSRGLSNDETELLLHDEDQ